MDDIYKYPEGHPCYGCVYIFHVSVPSCMIGCDADKCNLRSFEIKLMDKSRKVIKEAEKEVSINEG